MAHAQQELFSASFTQTLELEPFLVQYKSNFAFLFLGYFAILLPNIKRRNTVSTVLSLK